MSIKDFEGVFTRKQMENIRDNLSRHGDYKQAFKP